MFAELSHYDDTGELERITARTLLIWGDADGLVGHAMQTLLAERIAAELLVYPGVGHTPRWENPSRFDADVTSFVERLRPPEP